MLNWRKNQVATPGFTKLDNVPTPTTVAVTHIDRSKVELEDTSNAAYFYRHYRAEAREKLFYEELFESRMKHQQILEEKEKRRKKKQKGNRKSNGNRNRKKSGTENGHKSGDKTSDSKEAKDANQGKEDSVDSIDLTLPKLPKGPWSYKLGPEYDKRPEVPSNVLNEPVFNYKCSVSMEELKKRHLIKDPEQRKKLANWWKMPSHLIRRTDYGNMGNIKISMRSNGSRSPSPIKRRSAVKTEQKRNGVKGTALTTGKKKEPLSSSSSSAAAGGGETSSAEEMRKQELIKLYLKMKEKQKQCSKKEKKKKRKRHKDGGKGQQIACGPVDVRTTLLHRK